MWQELQEFQWMPVLLWWCKEHFLWVIEDVAQIFNYFLSFVAISDFYFKMSQSLNSPESG